MGSQTLKLHLGQLIATIQRWRRFFARQSGGSWTGIPPKCLQFGCWNSPSKRWVRYVRCFTYVHLLLSGFGSSGRQSIWSVLGWPRVSEQSKTTFGDHRRSIFVGKPKAENQKFGGLFVSFMFLLTNQSSCSLIQIRSCHWSTSGTVLSIILFYSDSFISLLTSTSYWFASSLVVMSSEGQSQKRLKTSAKWLSVHSQHSQIWEF